MTRRSLWVAILTISQRTADKISSRHQLTTDEVRDAVVCVSGLVFAWDVHPERGERAIVSARIRDRSALIVLYPTTEPDCWNLGSAYFVDH